jgi:hypothetical protein
VDNNKNTFNTDPRGNFKIPATDTSVDVSVTVTGYGTQNFRLSNNTYDNQLKLQPANSNLDKGLVLFERQKMDSVSSVSREDYSKSRKYRASYPQVMIQDAQPAYGWLAYEQYLEKNKRLPAPNAASAGNVVVSFEVNKKGELSHFNIEQSLSKTYDEEAIRLIKEGPAWKLLKGRKARITIIVRF